MPDHPSDGQINIPNWLNDSFLEKVLKSSEGDENLEVKSHEVNPATAVGDNYASDMYRVSVSFTRNGNQESLVFIVKAEPAKEEASKLVREIEMFDREAIALSSILPEMDSLLSAVSTEHFEPFSAKCLYTQSQPLVIVMEDLKQRGFKMAKRMLGFDMKHALLVIKQIARYHATSAVLYQKNPELIKPILDSVFHEGNKIRMEIFFGRSMKTLTSEVETWPDYNKRFAAKLKRIADRAVDLLIEIVKRDENDFNALVHGDMWLNNMMFQYSDHTEEVEKIRFLDFQLCHFSSPALDIQYFLHSSLSLELLDKHHILIEEYHKTLGQTLSLLGYEHLTPSLVQLQKQLEKKAVYAVIMSATALPFVLADSSTIPDVEKILKEDAQKETNANYSESCITAFKKLLPEFERKGWI